MDVFNGIRAFVATVDAGSFSQAARDLHLSKAALSKQVAALEDHLRVRLLHRTTRRLNLTHEGHVYLERVRQILTDLKESEAAISPNVGMPRGLLRVSTPYTFGTLHLTRALSAFMDRYPHIDLDIESTDRLVNLVEERIDIAVRISRMTDSTLIARKLTPAPTTLCATPAYWAEYGVPKHPRDLSRTAGSHTGLMYSYLSTPGEWRFQENGKPLSVKVAGNLSTNNDMIIRCAALNGQGIFHGPAFIVSNDIREGRLLSALDSFQEAPLDVYAAYPSRRNVSPMVRAFVDFLVEWFRHPPNAFTEK